MRETEAFRIYLWPRPEPFYRNRALPVRRPADWPAAITRLVVVFRSAEREPRIELFPELWPGLPEALEEAGFRQEMAAPVLVLTPELAARGVGGVELLGRGTPALEATAFLAGAEAAFHMPMHDPTELEQFRRDLEDGATLAALRLVQREPVAGACLIGIGREAELAGVWTAAGHRRQGHALAVCTALATRFFAAGGELIWLSAGGEGSEGLYRKLGFVPVGSQLNYALAAADPAASTPPSLDMPAGAHH